MAAMTERICANKSCKKPFMARTADVKRGWAKFCSKSCKAIKQEQRTGQYSELLSRNSGWDDRYDVDISDMDYGASDGGGYESIREG
ncbi:hypothetical protein KKY53_14715 [Pseudomonas aeruginosa]|uniref:hypothetical protein n=1 Tax=Pseudomonas aeruginosa TaxID=287 RepID=UPI000EB27802|nr:hypothetical protein [Pseudomonas aeruginosa]ELD5775023.1 hypothetical protein [Pseudomonas aeruginosa]MBI7006582.1 hypothetical protein [Pseudomonas aeruginosa]MBI7032026.1 hypothetical protein [Pseudomonas aeruginosa]MBI7190608.1 hypothetical protein [Pseudomonas aeruginosa]MBI7207828.1 hypothetical protein [Pseudomonas aeruginosa]